MDNNPDSPGGGRTPRKELQGPRPTPLKVRKDSHKIRKPPVAPPANPPQLLPQPPRQPVIIYTVSPKVIHTHPSEFMNLVQRLTGPDYATSSTTSHNPPPPSSSSSSVGVPYHNMAHHISGAISPAARLASIEKTKMHSEVKKLVGPSEVIQGEVINIDVDGIIGGGGGGGGLEGVVERPMFIPGILSPGPGSLPSISPNLFNSLFQDHQLNLSNTNNIFNQQQQQELGNRSLMEGSYVQSPFSTSLISPGTMFSPSLDFLHRVLDS